MNAESVQVILNNHRVHRVLRVDLRLMIGCRSVLAEALAEFRPLVKSKLRNHSLGQGATLEDFVLGFDVFRLLGKLRQALIELGDIGFFAVDLDCGFRPVRWHAEIVVDRRGQQRRDDHPEDGAAPTVDQAPVVPERELSRWFRLLAGPPRGLEMSVGRMV